MAKKRKPAFVPVEYPDIVLCAFCAKNTSNTHGTVRMCCEKGMKFDQQRDSQELDDGR